MPFTPYHMGLGAAIKAVLGKHFSLMTFGLAQFVMDIEALVHILRDDPVHHGLVHSYPGATLVAVPLTLLGRRLLGGLLRALRSDSEPGAPRRYRFISPPSRTAACSGAFLGTYSHVFLDSIVHSDMQPWVPLSEANGLLHLIPQRWILLLCIGLGIAGTVSMLLASYSDKGRHGA
ncbi:MAG: DUF4184 family protein [Pseudomonadota bacterium]